MPAERESLEAEVRKAQRELKGLDVKLADLYQDAADGILDNGDYLLMRKKLLGRKEKLGQVRERLLREREKCGKARQGTAASETEARETVEEAGQGEYREAFLIREYLHLEGYDKRVMASLIESAKVMREDRLEAAWKFGDVYEKILGEMR